MKHTQLYIAALCAVMATGCSTTRNQPQASVAAEQRVLVRTIPVNPPVAATINRTFLGSGAPGERGFENATQVDNDVYHAPQYMPGYPTAATIWPRVIEVACTTGPNGPQCNDYEWSPALGRGEYLYFKGVVAAAPVERSPAPPLIVPPPPAPVELKKPIRE